MSIKGYLIDKCHLIETTLDRLVPEVDVPHLELFHSARYSLLGGGKRLRPILTLATTEALNGDVDAALAPSCALEMIHTYSLIHDDLPCMDDDDFRRGKPSLHKAYSEGHAVLTGDFLLTHAFSVLAKAPHLSAEQKIKLIDILSRDAGGDGMIAGQVMDIKAEAGQINLDMLKHIHNKKTGALIVASLEFGGVISHASDQQMQLLRQFGQEIGLAFQIIDDVLDVTASELKRGSAIASDVANNKSTYVSLLGLEQSEALAQALFRSAISNLDQLGVDAHMLKELASYIVGRSY